jgi:predicted GNAT family acetyltransferase
MQQLDRPVWASLTTYHAGVSEGGELARRFVQDVNLFASSRDEGAEAVKALADLIRPGQKAFILQVPGIVIPPGLKEVKAAQGIQMLARKRVGGERAQEDITELGDHDAPEMLALATLTEPGPFLARTHKMGRFLGVRIDGRLAAMAGERMRFPGFTEVSGVCTHPDFRGRGLARSLSAAVMSNIEARGDRAFLHSWKSNTTAIKLYESLGFEWRADVNVSVLVRE